MTHKTLRNFFVAAPMIYAAVGYWCIGLGIGLSLAFAFGFAGLGIWIGLLSGLAATSVMLVGRWMRRDRLLRGLPA